MTAPERPRRAYARRSTGQVPGHGQPLRPRSEPEPEVRTQVVEVGQWRGSGRPVVVRVCVLCRYPQPSPQHDCDGARAGWRAGASG